MVRSVYIGALAFTVSSCRVIIPTHEAIHSNKQADATTDSKPSGPASSDSDPGDKEDTEGNALASEPVSVAGSYLTCKRKKVDAYADYGCTFHDKSFTKTNIQAADVDFVSIYAGSERLGLTVVWHSPDDALSFSFKDQGDRLELLTVKAKLKNQDKMLPATVKAGVATPQYELIWSDGFENLDLNTGTKPNIGAASWYFTQMPSWEIAWVPSQSGLPVCMAAPVVELQTESAAGALSSAQPKPFSGTYHIELDAGCPGSPAASDENNAKVTHKQPVKAGHWYQIEFSYLSRDGSVTPRFQFSVDADIVLDEKAAVLPTTWKTVSKLVKASSNSLVISFADLGGVGDGERGLLVDEIKISELK